MKYIPLLLILLLSCTALYSMVDDINLVNSKEMTDTSHTFVAYDRVSDMIRNKNVTHTLTLKLVNGNYELKPTTREFDYFLSLATRSPHIYMTTQGYYDAILEHREHRRIYQ